MEFFPDGAFVRLLSRPNCMYLHADKDGKEVSLHLNGPVPSLNTVWRAEHWTDQEKEITYLRLQSAAYGRYLSMGDEAERGHLGLKAVQGDIEDPPVPGMVNPFAWRWTAERVYPSKDYVLLRHHNLHLRANGRFRRWNTGVTVDFNIRRDRISTIISTMMQWTVQLVTATTVPRPLPAAPRPQILGVFWRRNQLPARTIRYVRASGAGNFDHNHENWVSFEIHHHSVFNLRTQLAGFQRDWNGEVLDFTLCVWPGSDGRLMPLVTDLPRSLDTMYIVVLRTRSRAAAALVYPTL